MATTTEKLTNDETLIKPTIDEDKIPLFFKREPTSLFSFDLERLFLRGLFYTD